MRLSWSSYSRIGRALLTGVGNFRFAFHVSQGLVEVTVTRGGDSATEDGWEVDSREASSSSFRNSDTELDCSRDGEGDPLDTLW